MPDAGSGRAFTIESLPSVDALLVSPRRLWDVPWTAYCSEFETVLAELLGAETVEIERGQGRLERALAPRFRARNAAARWTPVQAFSWQRPQRRHELAVIVVNDLRQLGVLAALRSWRSVATVFIAYVYEVWPAWLPTASQVVDEVVDQLDHVFVGIRTGADALRAMTSTPVSFVPPAVDVLAVQPAVTSDARRIDVSNRGRRDLQQHQVLRAWAQRTGRYYEFDTLHNATVVDPFEHRRHYYEQIARSRAFVANPARFDLPELSAGADEVGLRYLEALACGTVLVGDHRPGSPIRRVLDGAPGMLVLPTGAGALGVELEDLLGDDAVLHELGAANRAVALGRHDVVHRWETMSIALGVGPLRGAERRRAALRSAAGEAGGAATAQARTAIASRSAAR